jgi:hypothetical protein
MAESQGYLEPVKKTFIPVTSKEQWTAIEKVLTGMFASLNFRVLGRVIGVQRRIAKEGRHDLFIFIDGKIDPKMLLADKTTGEYDPMVQLVWRKSVVLAVSKQKQARLINEWKRKKLRKDVIADMRRIWGFDKSFVMYYPSFGTAKSLVQTFRKIDGIEVEW